MPTDTERLDWLEREANERDGIHLHNGNPQPNNHCRGIGLRPGSMVRTLREAIDQCMEFDPAVQTEPRAQSATDIQLQGCQQHGRRDCKTC